MISLKTKKNDLILGAFVFPGGVVDHVDSEYNGLNISIDQQEKFKSDLTFRVCAIREAFEESGIALFSPTVFSTASLAQWRTKVHKNAKEMGSFCNAFKCAPAVHSLIPYARWITPIQEPRSLELLFSTF